MTVGRWSTENLKSSIEFAPSTESTKAKSMTTTSTSDFIQPAEWAPHESCWLAWPSHGELWEDNLQAAQDEFQKLCEAIADLDPETNLARGDSLQVIVPNPSAQIDAEKALGHLPVTFHLVPFGDIWVRDTAPIFVLSKQNTETVAICYRFNGWGEKYVLSGDATVSEGIARASQLRAYTVPMVLEGGSIDTDGEGTFLTTEQCLLNPNRNPELTKAQIEEGLKPLGLQVLIWVKEGLLNDHTDGHIDTIARFVAPGKVVCMRPTTSVGGAADPNENVLREIEATLRKSKDAKGRTLEVLTVPSPGLILDEEGEVMPASYVNFYIGNSTVVVPTYGVASDEVAVREIQALFPRHRVVGSSAKAILSGGGAFHCITQQQVKPLEQI